MITFVLYTNYTILHFLIARRIDTKGRPQDWAELLAMDEGDHYYSLFLYFYELQHQLKLITIRDGKLKRRNTWMSFRCIWIMRLGLALSPVLCVHSLAIARSSGLIRRTYSAISQRFGLFPTTLMHWTATNLWTGSFSILYSILGSILWHYISLHHVRCAYIAETVLIYQH